MKYLEKKCFLLDANSILFRYIYAFPSVVDNKIEVNGIFGFLRFFLDLMNKNYNDFFLIAFDKCKNNFRKEISATYKQNREKILDKNIIEQVNLLIEICKIANIPHVFSDIYEADDLLATFAYHNPNHKKFILSTDKDFAQIINENTCIFHPFSKEIIENEQIQKKYGIDAKFFALFLALAGDSCDSIGGIYGVGPKTAAKIINITQKQEEMQKLFPQFDFTNLELMLSLTKFNTDADLGIYKNPNQMKILYKNLDEFFAKNNFISLSRMFKKNTGLVHFEY